MKLVTAITMVLGALIVSGCGSPSTIPMVITSLDPNGNLSQSVVTATAESSVAKETVLMNAYTARDLAYKDMYKDSGVSLSWEQKERQITTTVMVDDKPYTSVVTMTEYLPIMQYRPEPDWEQPLPLTPSTHPVWDASKAIAGQALKWGTIAFGIGSFTDLLDTALSEAGDYFNGPSNFWQSKNIAGTSQNFTQYDFLKASPSETGEDFLGIPGCSSIESFLAGRCSEEPSIVE